MLRSSITILLAIAFYAVTAQKKKSNDDVLFSINNRPVTTQEFLYLYKKNYQNKEEEFTKAKIEDYLTLFINFKLKVEEARTRGYDTTAAFIKEFTSYKEELRKPYLPEGKIIDSLVRLTYNRMKEEVRASHLLITVKPDASPYDTLEAYNQLLSIKKRALSGEDFENLALAYSQDPSVRFNKGDLGYFTAMQMVYPFENAAYSGKVGDVVGPVRTRFGYHLLKINGRQPARGEVEVSHIMIRISDEQSDDRAKNKIFEVYDQLRGGASWSELCTQYSEDVSTKDHAGKLRPFGVGAMSAVPEFEKASFSLTKEGEYTDPFKTAYGWHIVRLERKIPIPSFDELSANLKNRVMRDERVQISKQAASEKLKKDFQLKENEKVKNKVFALADSTLTNGKWKGPSYQNADKEKLFSVIGKEVTVSDFLKYTVINQKRSSLSPTNYIAQLYDNFIEASINELFEKKIIKENPDFAHLLNEYYEGILLFDIMEKEVWNKASEDSAGQHQYFLKHRNDYKAGERVDATIYASSDNGNIEAARQYVQSNDSLKLQAAIQARRIRVESGLFQKSDRPVLSKIDWKPGIYSAENNGMYYLVRVSKIVPPGGMSFEEARSAVISDYQNSLEKEWIDKLKKKYSVKVNDKSKKYIVDQLVK